MTPDDPRHGTNAGYLAHVESDRDYCQPCRDAHAEYQRLRWRRKYQMRTDALYVDALGVHRRIQALQMLGWRFADIDAAMGIDVSWAQHALTHTRVHVSRARTLAATYEALSMTLGPSSRVRTWAKRKQWAPPLAWNDIDDPNERPHGQRRPSNMRPTLDDLDPVAVERAMAGDRIELTKAERLEVVARLRNQGWSLRDIEDRTVITKAERYIERAAS